MNRPLTCVAALLLAASAAWAQTVSFKGKTVTMIIGYPAGGGTDLVGRVVASVLGRYLPGEPAVIVQNVPGADGLTALNYFAQQANPDGLTLTMGSGSRKITDDFTAVPYDEVEAWMTTLGHTPPEALDFVSAMIRRQGVKLE